MRFDSPVRRHVWVSVILTALGCSVHLTDAAEATAATTDRARYDDVLFALPNDWSRTDSDERSFVTLGAKEKQYLEWFNVKIFKSFESANTPRQQLDVISAELAKVSRSITSNNATVARHPAGWDSIEQTFTMDLGSSQKRWYTVYVARAGERLQVLEYVATNQAMWNLHLPEFEKLIADMRLEHLVVLAVGDNANGAAKAIPPLDLYMADQTADFDGWLLESPLTEDQRASLRQILIETWQTRNLPGIENVLQSNHLREQIEKLNLDQRDFARQKSLPEVLDGLHKTKDQRLSQLLLEIYDSGHQPLVTAEPPLTRQVTDASLETFYFLASQLEGVDVKPGADDKKQWAARTAEQYPRLDEEHRIRIAQMPVVWSAMRVAWPTLTPAQRQDYLNQFAALEPVRLLRPQVVLLSRLQAQQRTQQQAETYRVLSNMSAHLHAANMIAFSNFGGNTRYTWGR